MKRTFWSILALLVIVLCWYLAADRITPFTSNARVKAIITPITPPAIPSGENAPEAIAPTAAGSRPAFRPITVSPPTR